MARPEKQLREISRHFQIGGEFLRAAACPTGHINETWSATYNQHGARVRYLHQKINQSVFANPVALMNNIVRVTTHLRRKLETRNAADRARRALAVVPARSGRPFHRDDDGEYWRTYVFIEGARNFDTVESPAQAFEAARAFGEFQSLLADLPGARLAETIPNFHHTRKRFSAWQRAVHNDPCNRAQTARPEIEFALKHEPLVDMILNAMAKGKIPRRVTHNDTKFSNVLLDAKTGEALCVVDLDTVMPGCALYDFGDLVRSTVSPAREDERDLSKVKVRLPVFRQLAQGYFSTAGDFLTRAEKSRLAFAGKLITFETGLRFLTDYLNGDTYFRTRRPGQNLDRCRVQFKLVERLERQEEAMQKFVDGLSR
jgi:Ser/Thr protein kinase RdoA (MazF antagonist)